MNGAQDMGGIDGFGAVLREADEPLFHAAWERRVFALTLAMARPGGWTIDMSRFARENRPPQDYLGKSYYEIWLAGLEQLMIERQMVTPEEIAAGHAGGPAPRNCAVLAAADVAAALAKGGPTQRPAARPARFQICDHVRARTLHPRGHTRLPRYVRGHAGRIERVHGCHVFPDSSAAGDGETPQWLYSVRFAASDLWGERAEPGVTISVDAFEPYLEAIL